MMIVKKKEIVNKELVIKETASLCWYIPNDECKQYICDECPYKGATRIIIVKEDENER